MSTALSFVEPESQPAYLKTQPVSRSRIATFTHETIENGKNRGASMSERNRVNRQVEESIERIDA